MKDRILHELKYALDDHTIAFFAVVFSKEEDGRIVTSLVDIADENLADEMKSELASQLALLADNLIGRDSVPLKRLQEVDGIIRAYMAIAEQRDVQKLARWHATLSTYTWPDDLIGKPRDFDQLPDVFQGDPSTWDDYGSKATFVLSLCRLILQQIGAKEALKYHHIHNLKRSRLQFEWWYLKSWITGEWQ